MGTFRIVVSLLAIRVAAPSHAVAQSVRVINDVLVDATPSRAISEPYLAVDPRDPNHLLAGVIVSPPFGETTQEQHCAAFLSLDGGKHWARQDYPNLSCYDPWLAFLPDGAALFSSLGRDPVLAGEGDGLLVYRSADGGRTWAARPAGLGFAWDHPMIVADNTTSPRRGWVYLVSSRDLHAAGHAGGWVVSVARSVDGGKHFDTPRVIAPGSETVKAEPPAVLSDGTLIVPYVTIADDQRLLGRRRAALVRSSDGIDFSRPISIGDACGPPPTFLLSSLSADASGGRFRDRLYFSCTLPGVHGIAVSHSSDGGLTWSRPVSAAATRDEGPTRLLMASAVSSSGVFGVAWLEALPSAPGCRVVSFSASFDGGDTFTDPTRVSSAPSCANAKLNGPQAGYGDYFGLAGDSLGRFRLAWADARTGLYQLRTALIEVGSLRP